MGTRRSGPCQMRGGASIDGVYRYLLWRAWDETRPRLLWILLNPSKADAREGDLTLTRCISFSCEWGYGSLEIVNLFAYRTPSTQVLRRTLDPIGPENDRYIREAVARAKDIIVAWGEHGVYQRRDIEICKLLAQYPARRLDCLGKTANGCPRHPARMPSNTDRTPFLFGKEQ